MNNTIHIARLVHTQVEHNNLKGVIEKINLDLPLVCNNDDAKIQLYLVRLQENI